MTEKITKACAYCLKVFKPLGENEVGCLSCREKVDKLIREGYLINVIPKTLYERIRELERKIERLERNK